MPCQQRTQLLEDFRSQVLSFYCGLQHAGYLRLECTERIDRSGCEKRRNPRDENPLRRLRT